MNWRCPFCNHDAIVNPQGFVYAFYPNQALSNQRIEGTLIYCPNKQCNKFTFGIRLGSEFKTTTRSQMGKETNCWQLLPDSSAKPFPEYIPKVILQDYNEACLIKMLSPKASATLSRRCLQGMIRDFWKITKNTLFDEIDAIKDKVDPETWDAIDSVRQIGNIGAHMEKDINVMVDVDPEEAGLLIGLIETLIEEWYIARYQRQQRMNAITKTAANKKADKTKPPVNEKQDEISP